MNIIFPGDWIKFKGKWKQVYDTNFTVLRVWVEDFGPMWLKTDDEGITEVLSDSEMQKRIK